jgi:MIF4G domain
MTTLAMSSSLGMESEKNGYKKMSAITTMSMSGSEIPESLLQVLSIRSKPGLVCPEDIRSRIAQIRSRVESFRSTGIVRRMPPDGRADSFPSSRSPSHMGGGGGNNTFGRRITGRNEVVFWNRGAPSVAIQPPPSSAWSTSQTGRPKFSAAGLVAASAPAPVPAPAPATAHVITHVAPAAPINRFKSLETDDADESPSPSPAVHVTSGYVKFKSKFKKDAATANELDDRILGHIRAKINKFSAQNYKKILNFLRQNMDSEEKIFLEQFMALIFSKAAEEDTFVALYAQLLADLTPEFPFLKGEMQKLFTSYLDVFTDAEGMEDQTSVEYGKFLDATKRKTHRRGYSLFIAQIASKGLITEKELLDTTLAVARSLITNASDSEQKLLVEELADCLTNIMGVAHKSLNAFEPMRVMMTELKSLTAKPPAELPGLSFKSRFALMDCLGL